MPGTATTASPPRVQSLRRRRLVLTLLLLAAVTCAMVLSVVIGVRPISPMSVLDILILDRTRADTDAVVITTLRVPRTLLAVVVGVALGVAGSLIQAMTRNPLADPGLIGVNAGAALFVVLALTFLGWSGVLATTGAAVVGAASALAFAVLLTARRSFSPLVVVLVGTAFSATVAGITSLLLIIDSSAFDQVRFWRIGSLTGRDPDLLWPSFSIVAVATVLGLALAVPLATVALGEDMATSLGTSVTRTRLLVLGVSALLCGAATAVAGPIGFVGLAVPFLARRLSRGDVVWTLNFSALLGALALLVADTVGRLVVRPAELEVGIVVAVVGAPFLILIARNARIERP